MQEPLHNRARSRRWILDARAVILDWLQRAGKQISDLESPRGPLSRNTVNKLKRCPTWQFRDGTYAAIAVALGRTAKDFFDAVRPPRRSRRRGAPDFPLAPGGIVERDTLVGNIVEALLNSDARSPVLVHGPPGIGTTTAALLAGNHVRAVERFGSRRFFLPLERLPTMRDIEVEMARCLFGQPGPTDRRALEPALASQPTLILLDGLDAALLHSDAEELEAWVRWLSEIPNLAMMATASEREMPAGLVWRSFEPAPLTLRGSMELFRSRAGKLASHTDRFLPILRDLDGLPLAVSIFARNASAVGDVGELGAWWKERRLGLLSLADGGTRHNSVMECARLALSHPRLSREPEALRLLSLLALIPGGIGWQDLRRWRQLHAATILHLRGLVRRQEGRVRLFGPVAECVRELLPASSFDRRDLARRYLKRLEELGSDLPRLTSEGSLRRLRADRHCFAWSLDELHEEEIAAADSAIVAYAQLAAFGGFTVDNVFERIEAFARDRERPALRATASFAAGIVAAARFESPLAVRKLKDARRFFSSLGDRRRVADCIRAAGDALRLRRGRRAAPYYARALALYEQLDEDLGRGNCLRRLGDLSYARSEYETSSAFYRSALVALERRSDLAGQAGCLHGLANIELQRAQVPLAIQQRLPSSRLLDGEDRIEIAAALGEARSSYRGALRLCREMGARAMEANCVYALGNVAMARGFLGVAGGWYRRARARYQRIGHTLGIANCLYRQGQIALRLTDAERAEAVFRESLGTGKALGSKVTVGNAWLGLGDVAAARGDHVEAKTVYEQALAAFLDTEDPESIGEAHVALAQIASCPDERAHHLALARALLRKAGPGFRIGWVERIA